MNNEIKVIENFYNNPDEVREYALKCNYWHPFNIDNSSANDPAIVERAIADSSLLDKVYKYWFTSQPSNRYITYELISKLENIIDAKIDMKYARHIHPTGTLWGQGFNIYIEDNDKSFLNDYESQDRWNLYELDKCWIGVIYLTPDNIISKQTDFDFSLWDDDSEPIKDKYNTLILMKANSSHMINNGFGDTKENGRMIQTIFIKEKE